MQQATKSHVAGLVMLAVFSATPLFSQCTASVTDTSDSVTDPASLRYAIANASSGATICFSLTYPATITLTPASGPLTIGTSLTISGPGAANLAISGGGAVQVFNIDGGITVTISGVTVENGSTGNGGGIFNNGTLTVTNSALFGNSAANVGGGIFNFNNGTLTVTNSTLSGNSALEGGGISAYGTLTVINSTLSGNSATIDAGGISCNALCALSNSTVSGNSAPYGAGGGINVAGTMTVTNSTVSGNSASNGGGIWAGAGTLTVTNSTLSGNSASNGGGGIKNIGVTLTVTNSTLSGNSASLGGGILSNEVMLTAKNSIVANSASGGNCYLNPGPAVSDGHNLSDDGSCSSFFNQIGDLNNTPAGLDPSGLQNNGGPTQTIALLPSSPAVDAIPLTPINYCTATDGVTPISTDQRGVTRPQGSACDIGAFELVIPVICDTTYSGTYQGNLTISSGRVCITNGTVTGNVQQEGGSLTVMQSKVGGNMQIGGASTFTIGPGSTIGGNLQIQNLPSSLGQNQVCGSAVNGDLQFQNNGTAVEIGSASPTSCAGNRIGGNLTIQNNTAPASAVGSTVRNNLTVQNNSAATTVDSNTVTGNLQDQNNTAPTQVFTNAVGNNLQCQQNSSITGGGNTAKSKQGQCAAF